MGPPTHRYALVLWVSSVWEGDTFSSTLLYCPATINGRLGKEEEGVSYESLIACRTPSLWA